MFNKSDILNFVIANVEDYNGKNIEFTKKIPLDNPCIDIPDNAVKFRFYEYHQDNNTWDNPFNIYIGNKGAMEDVCKELVIKQKKSTLNSERVKFDNKRSMVVYFEDENGVVHIYDTINKTDVVVQNKEQLIQVIDFISDQIKMIGTHINHVRNLNLINNNFKNPKLDNNKPF